MNKLRVVDIGCGAGILSESLARLGLGQVVGVDPAEKLIKMGKRHREKQGEEVRKRLEYRVGSVEEVK